MGWIGFLLVLALGLAVVGAAFEGLRWLMLVALVVAITGTVIGWSRRGQMRTRSPV